MKMMTLFPSIPDEETANAVGESFSRQFNCQVTTQAKCHNSQWSWEVMAEISAVQVAAMLGDTAANYALQRLFSSAIDVSTMKYEKIKPMVLEKLQVADTKGIKKWLKVQGLNISLATNEGWRKLMTEVLARA